MGFYIVDGYDDNINIVYEFYGCYWYGCFICYFEFEVNYYFYWVDCIYGGLYEEILR